MTENCITYYSKKGCPPCDFWYKMLQKRYDGCYEIITAETEEEALSIVKKYGVKTVPFIVKNDGTVLANRECDKFIMGLSN